jgi:hypothetical protein
MISKNQPVALYGSFDRIFNRSKTNKLQFKGVLSIIMTGWGCYSLVVVFSLSKREVVNSSPARADRVKPKMFKIGSDCSFVKSTAFRSENHESFAYDLKNGGPVSQ